MTDPAADGEDTAGPGRLRPAALAIEDLQGGYGEITVLRNVTLAVEPAALVALLGPNGAGKTTLLKTVAGLVAPTAGRVFVGGKDVTAIPPTPAAEKDCATFRRVGAFFAP